MKKSKKIKGMRIQRKRDLEILMFLWKFKVATTGMIYTKFFKNVKVTTAYKVLLRLKKQKLIACNTNKNGQQHVWTLQKKGFNIVKGYLPELQVESYQSDNKEHDLICSSIHLGEYINGLPSNVKIITEQMLKSFSKEFLPDYIPDAQEHRPDGYWYFENGNKIKLMALEVEKSEKSSKRYEACSYFYDEFGENDRCLWIVKSKNHAKKILRAMYKEEPEYRVHNFVLLEDILQNGWNSKVFAGPEKYSFLSNLFVQQGINKVGTRSEHVYHKLLLDNRVTYRLHSEKPLQNFLEKSDSIGI